MGSRFTDDDGPAVGRKRCRGRVRYSSSSMMNSSICRRISSSETPLRCATCGPTQSGSGTSAASWSRLAAVSGVKAVKHEEHRSGFSSVSRGSSSLLSGPRPGRDVREARAFHSVAESSTGISHNGQRVCSLLGVPANCNLFPVRLMVLTVEGCETFNVAMKPVLSARGPDNWSYSRSVSASIDAKAPLPRASRRGSPTVPSHLRSLTLSRPEVRQ